MCQVFLNNVTLLINFIKTECVRIIFTGCIIFLLMYFCFLSHTPFSYILFSSVTCFKFAQASNFSKFLNADDSAQLILIAPVWCIGGFHGYSSLSRGSQCCYCFIFLILSVLWKNIYFFINCCSQVESVKILRTFEPLFSFL